MKKTKVLPLLLLMPLLTSCGNGELKAPKFAKFGEEIKFDKFEKTITGILDKSVIHKSYDAKKTENNLGSYEVSAKTAELVRNQTIRNKKTISQYDDLSELDNKIKFDSKELLYATQSTKRNTEATSHDAQTKLKMVNEIKADLITQKEKIKDVNYLVSVDKTNKTYRPSEVLPNDVDLAKKFDTESKIAAGLNILIFLASAESDYKSADAKEQKNYHFYQNGNIFTVDYSRVDEGELRVLGNVVGKEKTEWKTTVQTDLTEGKWVVKYFDEYRVTKTYSKNTSAYAKDDAAVQLEQNIAEVHFTTKNVKLKRADISKMTPVLFPEA